MKKSLLIALGASFVFAVLMALSSAPAEAACSSPCVQDKHASICCTQAILDITLDSNVTQGNLIALYIWADDTARTISSVSGSNCQSNAFTYAGDNPKGPGATGQAWGYYSKNISGGSCTIRVTLDDNAGAIRMITHEVSGRDGTAPLDGHNGKYNSFVGTGTDAIKTNAVTTTTNNQYIFAAITSSSSMSTASAGTGFTIAANSTLYASEYQVQANSGSIEGTFTQSQDGFDIQAIIMTFKESTGGGGGGTDSSRFNMMGVGR